MTQRNSVDASRLLKFYDRIPFTVYCTACEALCVYHVWKTIDALTYPVINICSVLVLWQITILSPFATRQGCVIKSSQQSVSKSDGCHFQAKIVKSWHTTSTFPLILSCWNDSIPRWKEIWLLSHQMEGSPLGLTWNFGRASNTFLCQINYWEFRVCPLQLLLITYPNRLLCFTLGSSFLEPINSCLE